MLNKSAVKVFEHRCLACLQEKFVISEFHLLALFLNPKFKCLVSLTSSKRTKIYTLAKELIHSCFKEQIAVNTHHGSDHTYIVHLGIKSSSSCTVKDDFLDCQGESYLKQKKTKMKFFCILREFLM